MIVHQKMKEIVFQEYKRWLVKLLKNRLNSGNLMKTINTFALPITTYFAEILNWTKDELIFMDRITGRILPYMEHFTQDPMQTEYT